MHANSLVFIVCVLHTSAQNWSVQATSNHPVAFLLSFDCLINAESSAPTCVVRKLNVLKKCIRGLLAQKQRKAGLIIQGLANKNSNSENNYRHNFNYGHNNNYRQLEICQGYFNFGNLLYLSIWQLVWFICNVS